MPVTGLSFQTIDQMRGAGRYVDGGVHYQQHGFGPTGQPQWVATFIRSSPPPERDAYVPHYEPPRVKPLVRKPAVNPFEGGQLMGMTLKPDAGETFESLARKTPYDARSFVLMHGAKLLADGTIPAGASVGIRYRR